MSTKPFSIRLTFEERARLEQAAGNRPLGAYVREELLGADGMRDRPTRQPKTDQKALAGILAVLGASEVGPSLRSLAKAAELGALPESPEAVSEIRTACRSVEALRLHLIAAIGIKPESGP